MARRGRGEGSIQATSDGRFKAVIHVADPLTGRRKRIVRRARTKTEAREKLRAVQRELDQAGAVGNSRASVADAVERWLAVKAGERLAPATTTTHEWLTGIIVDAIGEVPLAGLTVHHCDTVLRLAADGLNGRKPANADSVRRLRSTLISILKNARREGLVTRNVAEDSVLPVADAGAREKVALPVADRERLVETTSGTSIGALVVLCSRLALRPAEARGLRWVDIDLDAGELSIVRQMDSANKPTRPKTKDASRRIEVDGCSLALLREWRRRQAEVRLSVGPMWSDHDAVVTTGIGTVVNKDNLGRMLHGACDEAGVERVTPYDLRHTALTILAGEGYSNWQLADYAGTSERMIDDVYRHRTDGVIRLDNSRRQGRRFVLE